jgi:hypothetical protein
MPAVKLIATLAFAITCTPALASNWPQWRGPEGNSVCRDSGMPLVWRENFNLAWKTALPGWGQQHTHRLGQRRLRHLAAGRQATPPAAG